jgi:nickel/cobalt exporter
VIFRRSRRKTVPRPAVSCFNDPMRRFLVPLLALPFLTAVATAHPLPNKRFDRTVTVRITPGGVTVRYSLELNDWTMTLDGKEFLTAGEMGGVKNQREFAALYAGKKARLLADNLRGTLDGGQLTFRPESHAISPDRDHLRIDFVFKADWQPAPPPATHAFAFEDQNFEDRSGKVTLTLAASGDGLDVLDLDDPADLRGRSPLDYKPGDEKRARQASATFVLKGTPQPAVEPTPPPAEPPPPPASLWEDVRDRGLVAVFDSGLGLGLMLLLCAVFGMAHAFTPGHGKTMVAAYLVGERGTVRHAAVLGLVATVAHTGSVIGVAAVVYFVYGNDIPAEAQGWLMLAGGLLIAGVGLWLFAQRVRGRADHVHLFADHHHHHDHDHDHSHDHHHGPDPAEAKTNFGWARVVLLGLGGGIIPCWDAVLLLLAAIALQQVAWAIPLLIAFSAGLGAILVVLGVGVVYAHRAGATRFQESRWFQFLPVVSALLLVGIGFWLCQEGLRAAMK